MDKLQWFKFMPTDWVMGKIQRCPEVTQARFIRLICIYWNKECILNYSDAEIEIDKEHLQILIAKKIVKIENDFLIIDFLNEQLYGIAETSKKRREAVLKRWSNVKKNDTSVLQMNESVLQNDTEKSREDKSREDKSIDSRKLKFAATLKPFVDEFGRDTLKDFYDYWTEPNKSNTKFRQELEKTWSLDRRIQTWIKNESNFKPNKNKNNEQLTEITAAARIANPRI
jgi:hypothetical protein